MLAAHHLLCAGFKTALCREGQESCMVSTVQMAKTCAVWHGCGVTSCNVQRRWQSIGVDVAAWSGDAAARTPRDAGAAHRPHAGGRRLCGCLLLFTPSGWSYAPRRCKDKAGWANNRLSVRFYLVIISSFVLTFLALNSSYVHSPRFCCFFYINQKWINLFEKFKIKIPEMAVTQQ